MVLRFCIYLSLFLVYSCSNSSQKDTFKEDKPEPRSGETLYMIHCESCHGLEGDKGISGAANLKISKFNNAQILSVIKNGNQKGMMPFRNIITDKEELISLVEHVKSLRK